MIEEHVDPHGVEMKFDLGGDLQFGELSFAVSFGLVGSFLVVDPPSEC